MGHSRAAEKDHFYSPHPAYLPHRQCHLRPLCGSFGTVRLYQQYGRVLPGAAQHHERRRLRHGDGVCPGHPALYQRLHYHPAADSGDPAPGAAGPGRRGSGQEEDPGHHPLRYCGHRPAAGLGLLHHDPQRGHPDQRERLGGPGHHRDLYRRRQLPHVAGRAGQ